MNDDPKIRILVVEDEPAIRSGLCDVLAYHHYEPTGVDSGEDGLREGSSGAYGLVLLDVMLPGLSGFEVCRTLRAECPTLPILMLTARGAESDVLEGFSCGADDYVTKPFSLAQLLARVDALLRRAGRRERQTEEPFRAGDLEVDPQRLVARAPGLAEEAPLTRREVDMLALLASEAGRVVPRSRLLQEVWGIERADRIETRTVDMHVAKLRKKLGKARTLIETVRGEGYRLAG
jgi:two-component system response regulator RegX3